MTPRFSTSRRRLAGDVSLRPVFVATLLVVLLAPVLSLHAGTPRVAAESVITDARYVSASAGDDANDGTTPDRPWQTLAKVSDQTFGPGAVIYLRRGDVWNEALIPQGSGDFAAGEWITVTAYGPESSPNPTIDRTEATDANRDFAIKLVDLEAWSFEDLVIRNSRTGFVYLGSDETVEKHGLVIKNVVFEQIRGLPSHAQTAEEDERPYRFLRGSTAISITGFSYCRDNQPATDENCLGDKGLYIGSWGAGLSDVTIEDVKINDATYGIWIWGGGYGGVAQNYTISRPELVGVGTVGIELTFVQEVLVDEPRIYYTGGTHSWSGQTGMDVNIATNVTIQNGEIAYGIGEQHEGEAINLNGNNYNVAITGMDLHHNDGPAIAIQGVGPPENATYVISGNRVWENALRNDRPSPNFDYPELLLTWNPPFYGANSSAQVTNNLIAVKPGRAIVVAVDDIDSAVWKYDLSMEGETHFPPGYLFCGNRDISAGEADPPLIAGNGECDAP